MKVRVEINGVDRKLAKLAKEVDNLRVPLRQSGIYMESSIGKRFRAGGGSAGMWKPLAASTIERHPHRAGGKPLNDTGDLKRSVTTGSSKRITAKRLYYGFGSGVVYAAAHNFGHKQIPQRQFLYFDAADERAIKRIFNEYIEGLVE